MQVANLPAEIAHLLEEIKAKDELIVMLRDTVNLNDGQLQRHLKEKGLVKNPKEVASCKVIFDNYTQMEKLQKEKIALSHKAMVVLERQVKRYDIKLRELQMSEQLPRDPTLPSLLHPSIGNVVTPLSGTATPLTSNDPLQASTNLSMTTAALNRMSNAARSATSVTGPGSLLSQTPLNAAQSIVVREGSVDSTKRRRLNSGTSLVIPPSGLRQSSSGPGAVSKATTPASSSRAGSAQPSKTGQGRRGPGQKKGSVSAAIPTMAGRKRARGFLLPPKKGDKRGQRSSRERSGMSRSLTPTESQGSPSESAGDLGSPDPNDDSNMEDATIMVSTEYGDGEVFEDGQDRIPETPVDEDKAPYCLCGQPSFGIMVACDNTNCKILWFHLNCVELKEPPPGDWLCPACRLLPKNKLKLEPSRK